MTELGEFNQLSSRLSRMESKIDDLSKAMVSLARAEEKLVSIEKNHYLSYERLNKLSMKIEIIEAKANDNSRSIRFLMRIFWLTFPVILAALIGVNVIE